VRRVPAVATIGDMKVQDAMSKQPRAVRMVDRLDEAARILWEQDCGFVPVVDGADVLCGVLTDRDLCMASYTQGRPLSEIPVLAVMAREVVSCRPDDVVKTVMQAMQSAQVHRLPVIDTRGVLVGVLAINDLLRISKARPAALDAGAVMATLAGITAPRKAVDDASPTVEAAKAGKAGKAPKVEAAATAAPAVEPAPVAKPAARAAARASGASKARGKKRKA